MMRKKVLVVEDDLDIANSLSELLRRRDYETRVVTDGVQASVELENFQPDVVTLDLGMPGVDGYKLIRFIRSTPAIAETKIIVVSGKDNQALQDAVDMGADASIQKPFTIHGVTSVIEELLNSHAA